MCSPAVAIPLIAGTAMQAGGKLLSDREAQKNAESRAGARNSVLAAGLDKQRAHEAEARGYFDQRLKDYDQPTQEQALTGAQDKRTGVLTGNMTADAPDGDIPVTASAPAAVKGEIAKRMLESFRKATDRAKASGKLGGYGDVWLGNDIGVADTARRVSTVNNFSRGDASILGSQMDLAEIGAPQKNSIWGPILSAGGQLVSGMSGAPGAAGGGAVLDPTFGGFSRPGMSAASVRM